MNRFLIFGIAIVCFILAAFLIVSALNDQVPESQLASSNPPGVPTLPAPSPATSPSPSVITAPASPEIIADNLAIPWSLAWLPDKTLLFTERPGRLNLLGPDRKVIPVANVAPVGEGGLLGLAVHPGFNSNQFIYLYYTLETDHGLANQVDRYRLVGNHLQDRRTIINNIPGSQFHDGGRLAFGPDGKLYLTTGDAGQENSAQDINSLAGKILRLNDDGSIPANNPFGNAVYSYGHRNPQGIAWDEAGRLWATEHGRSGALSGYDEINLIKPGQNYGWPTIQGDATKTGLFPPLAHSGPRTTWAPASAAILNQTLYFGGLRGEALYQVKLTGEKIAGPVTVKLSGEFGRIREVAIGPDGWLYLTTSNTDGRGEPQAGDDKIIRLNPANLDDSGKASR